MSRTVQDFLGASPTARIAARLELGGRRAVTIWENRDDRVLYEKPEGHTFSFYLAGGTGTRRLDAGGVAGWPGAVSIRMVSRCRSPSQKKSQSQNLKLRK